MRGTSVSKIRRSSPWETPFPEGRSSIFTAQLSAWHSELRLPSLADTMAPGRGIHDPCSGVLIAVLLTRSVPMVSFAIPSSSVKVIAYPSCLLGLMFWGSEITFNWSCNLVSKTSLCRFRLISSSLKKNRVPQKRNKKTKLIQIINLEISAKSNLKEIGSPSVGWINRWSIFWKKFWRN